MSESSEVIQEFLVSVGYDTDMGSMKKFLSDMETNEDEVSAHGRKMIAAIKKFVAAQDKLANDEAKAKKRLDDNETKARKKKEKEEAAARAKKLEDLKKAKAALLAVVGATLAAGVAVVAGVSKIASEMEELYFASRRTNSAVQDLQAFEFANRQVGLSAGEATAAVDELAARIRTQPGLTAYINGLGIRTKGREATQVLHDILVYLKRMRDQGNYAIAAKIGQDMFGLNEQTLFKMIDGLDEADAAQARYNKSVKESGLNVQELADQSHKFQSQLRNFTDGDFTVFLEIIEKRFLPLASTLLKWGDDFIKWMIRMDHETDGLSTEIGVGLVAAFASLLTASVLLPGVLKAVGTAIRGIGVAFRFALLLFEADPIVLAITAIVLAVAALAYAVYDNWSLIKKYFFEAAEWIKKQWAQLLPGILSDWNRIKTAFKTGIDWVTKNYEKAADLVIGYWSNVKAVFTDSVNWMVQKIDWLIKKYNAIAPSLGLPTIDELGNSAPSVANDNGTPYMIGGQPTGGQVASHDESDRVRWGNPATDAMFRMAGDLLGRAGNWTKAQVAGILSNLSAESGLNPAAVGDGGKAYGIAQWHPDRQAAFAQWAGHDIHGSSLQEQLGFVAYEMNHGLEKHAGKMLDLFSNDPYGATGAVTKYYERPLDPVGEARNRQQMTEKIVNILSGGNRTSAPLAPSPTVLGAIANDPTGAGGKSVVIHQKTDIHVDGSRDPTGTGRAVADAQGRVNGDVVRNLKANYY